MTCLLRIIFTDRQIPYLSPRLPCLWSKVGKRLYAADNVRNSVAYMVEEKKPTVGK